MSDADECERSNYDTMPATVPTYTLPESLLPPSDAEDDWGESVEAFRDRQRRKQQGAERPKAAGFTDSQVKNWEEGENKDEPDVTWTKRGQAREWDRDTLPESLLPRPVLSPPESDTNAEKKDFKSRTQEESQRWKEQMKTKDTPVRDKDDNDHMQLELESPGPIHDDRDAGRDEMQALLNDHDMNAQTYRSTENSPSLCSSRSSSSEPPALALHEEFRSPQNALFAQSTVSTHETNDNEQGSLRITTLGGSFETNSNGQVEDVNDNAESMHSIPFEGDRASWTESSIFSKEPKAQSTQATSAEYDEGPRGPSTVTLYNYSKLDESTMGTRAEDLVSVKSLPPDDLSESGTLPGVARYQHAAARYIVKVLVEDRQLLSMYEEAVQKTDKARFVRNHEKLLHGFFLSLGSSSGRSPSELSAIRFLARKQRRVLISTEIYGIVAPSDGTLREKLQIQLDKEQSGAFLIARWLADQDNSESLPVPEKKIDHDTTHEDQDSDSESKDETAEENILLKLESTAGFLVSGPPFESYKQSLQAFLHTASAHSQTLGDPILNELQDTLEKGPMVLNAYHDGHSGFDVIDQVESGLEGDRAHVVDRHISQEPEKDTETNSTRGPKQGTLKQTKPQHQRASSLPMLVDFLLQYLPYPYFEPAIPEGKVRARWRCVCFLTAVSCYTS